MPTYTQADRPLVATTPLGKDVLLATSFRGHEGISELFNFQLDLLADVERDVPFDRILGQHVTVEMRLGDGTTRHFHGMVSRFSQGGRDDAFVQFRAALVPDLWRLTKKVRSRIFQHFTVPDILRQVLSGLDVAYEILGTYFQRDYCVQYRESDFQFVSRIMEEEGIYYFFKHTEAGHQMIVTDVPDQHPGVLGQSAVVYEELSGGEREDLRITSWEKTQELRSGKVTLRDHCFELPGNNPLEAQQAIVGSVTAGKATHKLAISGNDQLEIYDYPGRYAQRFDGVGRSGEPRPQDLKDLFRDKDRVARIRIEEEEAGSLEIAGASNCGHFVAGHTFTLERHFDADDAYLLTRIEHDAHFEGNYRSDEAVPFSYENRFTCRPVTLAFRPPRVTPRPLIAGVQTATVVAHRGEEILCDEYGRVKVQFHWDRDGKYDGDSSCWLRVAQPWAGKKWGAFFWPRVGNEVVVAFEEGDPDQPIVVGSVYNFDNRPPYTMPLRTNLAGFKSVSFRGEPFEHFNGIIFSDEKDHEHLAIHSQRHMTFNTEHDKSFHAGRHKNEEVSSVSTFIVGSLPGGGGSGGGGPDKWSPMKHTDPAGVPGLNSTVVYGENFQATVGINNQLTVGSNLQICVNPAALMALADVSVVTPQLISGLLGSGVGGNMQLTLGSSATIVAGQTFDIKLGKQHFTAADSKDHLGTQIVCLLIGAVALLWVVLYGISEQETGRVTMVVAFQALISVLLMTLMTMEEAYSRPKHTLSETMHELFKATESTKPPTLLKLKDQAVGIIELVAVAALAVAPALIAAQAEPDPPEDENT